MNDLKGKIKMTEEKIKNDEMMSEEELNEVTGGNALETVKKVFIFIMDGLSKDEECE